MAGQYGATLGTYFCIVKPLWSYDIFVFVPTWA
jgi:hypothetical protein